MQPRPDQVILEPCAGTGAIAIHLAKKAKRVIATDISPYAVHNIQQNIALHNLADKIEAFQADLFPPNSFKYDLIVINPPYTDHQAIDEIERALWDAEHRTLHRFFKEAKKYLKKSGILYSTWSNFADFAFFENTVKKYGYRFRQIAEASKDRKIYRVYELR